MRSAGETRRVRVGAFAVAVAALGILLWARLILVTGHPRTAIATPDAPTSIKAKGQKQSEPLPQQVGKTPEVHH